MKMHELVADVIGELDDGGGFRTSEAAGLLHHRAKTFPDLYERLARMGAQRAIAEYRPQRASVLRAADAIVHGQQDFAEVFDDFAHWIADIAALEEGTDAMRKRFVRMTYGEFVAVIELAERKAGEMHARARTLRAFLRDHPQWAARPEMTLAELLGVDEAALRIEEGGR